MMGQQKLPSEPAAGDRCATCDRAATHQATWRRAAWMEHRYLCTPHAKLEVAGTDPPHRLRLLEPVARQKPEPQQTLPLDL